jgi:SRSO17 transposase
MHLLGAPPRQEDIGMDADTILSIRPALTEYLRGFDACMGRLPNRRHLDTYVSGQLSNLQRKSIEPIADAAGVAPRTLQEFLSLLKWDDLGVIDCLQRRVARRHADAHSIGIVDETSFPKRGEKTACVQRQHCGALGKVENCVVTVQLGYAAGDFHTLLDGVPYLPEETWNDPDRRAEAGIPDEIVYRPKWFIALEMIQHAQANGVRFEWLTFDEGYGGKPPFLRELETMGQNYVAEIPGDTVGWTSPPEVHYQDHARDQRQGRSSRKARLKVRNPPAVEVRNILTYSPVLRKVAWERFRVKDGEKGPMIWEAKRIELWIKDEHGLPAGPYHVVIARSLNHPEEVKYFLSNAPVSTSLEVLLLVAFSRWRIERMFEDSKSELGMNHFEVRKYLSIQRHLVLTCVSHLFLAEFCLAQRGKKPGGDGLPGPHGHLPPGVDLVSRWPVLAEAGGVDRRAIGDNAGPQSQGPSQPLEDGIAGFTGPRHHPGEPQHLSLASGIAL